LDPRFVLDANLSPLTRSFLADQFGLDVVDLLTLGLGHIGDDEVYAFAQRERRVIITLDLDFGEIFHRSEPEIAGVIILRLEDTSIESVNRILARFFARGTEHIDLDRSLVLIEEHRVRIRSL
jgi:predicted nuclease of predicted toxin-antitoxin system